jgi:Domain of unknown function (DUF6457)
VTLDEWVAAVSQELGIGEVDAAAVLDLARDVAHGVARPAAPLTCLLIGLAASGADDLDAIITRVRALLPPDSANLV